MGVMWGVPVVGGRWIPAIVRTNRRVRLEGPVAIARQLREYSQRDMTTRQPRLFRRFTNAMLNPTRMVACLALTMGPGAIGLAALIAARGVLLNLVPAVVTAVDPTFQRPEGRIGRLRRRVREYRAERARDTGRSTSREVERGPERRTPVPAREPAPGVTRPLDLSGLRTPGGGPAGPPTEPLDPSLFAGTAPAGDAPTLVLGPRTPAPGFTGAVPAGPTPGRAASRPAVRRGPFERSTAEIAAALRPGGTVPPVPVVPTSPAARAAAANVEAADRAAAHAGHQARAEQAQQLWGAAIRDAHKQRVGPDTAARVNKVITVLAETIEKRTGLPPEALFGNGRSLTDVVPAGATEEQVRAGMVAAYAMGEVARRTEPLRKAGSSDRALDGEMTAAVAAVRLALGTHTGSDLRHDVDVLKARTGDRPWVSDLQMTCANLSRATPDAALDAAMNAGTVTLGVTVPKGSTSLAS